VVPQLAKVLTPQAKWRGAVELGVAAHVVVGVPAVTGGAEI
jgi:hypothetical protein